MGIIQFRHNRSAICRGARLVTILMCKLKSYQYRKPIDSLVLSQYAVRYAVSRYSTSSVPSTMEDDNATQLAASPLQYCTKYRTDCTWYFYYIIIIGVSIMFYRVLSCSIVPNPVFIFIDPGSILPVLKLYARLRSSLPLPAANHSSTGSTIVESIASSYRSIEKVSLDSLSYSLEIIVY